MILFSTKLNWNQEQMVFFQILLRLIKNKTDWNTYIRKKMPSLIILLRNLRRKNQEKLFKTFHAPRQKLTFASGTESNLTKHKRCKLTQNFSSTEIISWHNVDMLHACKVMIQVFLECQSHNNDWIIHHSFGLLSCSVKRTQQLIFIPKHQKVFVC